MPDAQSMIGRLRAAIRDEVYRQGDEDDGPFVGGFGEMAAGPADVYLDGVLDTKALVRAVLTAMREPTEAMVDAMVRTHVPEDFENMGCERCFIAAIDAALAEGV